jgi:FPC/CPF motif-containing protein YcgG
MQNYYERNKFEQFIVKTYSKNRIFYIKNKGSKLWGQLQSLPRHNQEPSAENILTKTDIVKQFYEQKQGNTPPLEKRNFTTVTVTFCRAIVAQ